MNIIVFTGAGISAESGLPTFRTQGGLWENHKIEDVCTPEAFNRDPQFVWSFYRQLYHKYSGAEPNAGHFAITKLQEHCAKIGVGFRVITQNVDNLHQRAGTQDVIQIHGTINKFRCMGSNFGSCTYAVVDDNLWNEEKVPLCPQCNAEHLRPCVVWFNEVLPFDEMQTSFDLSKVADAVIVVGTSAQVFPAADVVFNAYRYHNAKLYEFNPDKLFGWTDPNRYEYWGGGSAQSLPAFVEKFIKENP